MTINREIMKRRKSKSAAKIVSFLIRAQADLMAITIIFVCCVIIFFAIVNLGR